MRNLHPFRLEESVPLAQILSRLAADLKLDGAGRNVSHDRARVPVQAHRLTRRQLYLLDFDVLNQFTGGERGSKQ